MFWFSSAHPGPCSRLLFCELRLCAAPARGINEILNLCFPLSGPASPPPPPPASEIADLDSGGLNCRNLPSPPPQPPPPPPIQSTGIQGLYAENQCSYWQQWWNFRATRRATTRDISPDTLPTKSITDQSLTLIDVRFPCSQYHRSSYSTGYYYDVFNGSNVQTDVVRNQAEMQARISTDILGYDLSRISWSGAEASADASSRPIPLTLLSSPLLFSSLPQGLWYGSFPAGSQSNGYTQLSGMTALWDHSLARATTHLPTYQPTHAPTLPSTHPLQPTRANTLSILDLRAS